MSNLTRKFWIVADLYDGNEVEYLFPATKEAEARAKYESMRVPFKKLVAITDEGDITLEVQREE